MEGVEGFPVTQGTTIVEQEEGRLPAQGQVAITPLGVLGERFGGAGVQGYVAGLVELGLAHAQHPPVQI